MEGRGPWGRGIRAALLVVACAAAPAGAEPADPLPSWNDGPSRKAITDFVARVTQADGADFVPVAERIAVFDNDGTLWCEQPMYVQLAFAIDRVKACAAANPEWKEKEPFKAILEGNVEAALEGGDKAILDLVMATHAGMTPERFGEIVADWIATARHPRTGKLYTEMVYQPMLELLAYLRANGFKTYVVSGGGVEFMRAWGERVYGIPPEQVIGSRIRLTYVTPRRMAGGQVERKPPELIRLPEVDFVDDGSAKAVAIQHVIGRRPIAAFGNSDGDLQMLQWTVAGGGPRFALVVRHTDAEREWAYDRTSHIGKLDKALDEAEARDWTVVDMKRDWKSVFPPAGKR